MNWLILMSYIEILKYSIAVGSPFQIFCDDPQNIFTGYSLILKYTTSIISDIST